MTFNSEKIIQDIRSECEGLIDMVTNEEAKQASADQIERSLFKRLLSLGAQLLQLFFIFRGEQSSREPIEQGTESLPYQSDKRRRYYSIFGLVFIWRPYFYKQGVGSGNRLDEELSLGEGSYSDMVRELAEYLGVYVTYSKDSDLWSRIFGLSLSTRAIQDQVVSDAADVKAFYEQKPAPARASEGEILVLQGDGKGVPLILEEAPPAQRRLGKGQKRGQKKEAIVTSVYTIAPKPRTPYAVLSSFFNPAMAKEMADNQGWPKPQNKQLWATLAGKDTALARLAKQVAQRQGDHIQDHVALCDGCEALQTRIQRQFPEFTLILDFIHANEYLWKTANVLWGENDPQRDQWVAEQTLQLLTNHTDQVITDLRALAQADQTTLTQRRSLLKTANYFERNLPYMDYLSYLQRGWPIASGVIEGACRHLVKDRFELSGMRWSYDGAEALLHLRAVAENGDWETYHAFRRHRRHHRLYATELAQPDPPELKALAAQSVTTLAQKQPVSPDDPQSYHSLPLAA